MPVHGLLGLYALLTVVFGAGLVLAAPEASPFPEGAFPQDVSDLPPDPAVHYGVLENGLRYAVMENGRPAGTLSLRLGVDVGSLDETDEERGVAHFVEHMAFAATERFPDGTMVKALERVGLRLGADTNATTTPDLTSYRLDLPNVADETVETAFAVLREIAGAVTFPPEAVERERGVIAAEATMRDTLAARRVRDWQRLIYPGTLIPRRAPIGTERVVQRASPALLKDFYRRHYRPERAFLTVVGDLATDDAHALIRETFGDWGPPTTEQAPRPPRGRLEEPRVPEAGLFVDPDQTTVVSLVWPRIAEPDRDTAATRRAAVLEGVANALFAQRLRTVLEPGDAPFLDADISSADAHDMVEGPVFTLSAEPDRWHEALAAGMAVLRQTDEFGFTDEEVDRHVAALDAAYDRAITDADNRSSPLLATALLGSMRYGTVFTSPQNNRDRLRAFRDQITAGTVTEAFRAQFQGPPRIHLATNDAIPGGTGTVIDAYRDALSRKISPPAEEEALAFAYGDFGTPGRVVQEGPGALGERQIRFANNVRLNVKKTDYEAGRVWVRVTVAGGLLPFAEASDGAAYFARAAFASGGLGEHSISELERLLSGRKVGFGMGLKSNVLAATNVTTPEDLLLQLQLHAALLTDPGYRPAGERRYQRLIERAADSFDASPNAVASTQLTRWLRGGDVRFGTGSTEALLAHGYSDVAPLLRDQLENGYIEIGIVGDIDEDAAIDAVAQTFGALPERRATPLAYEAAREVSFPKARHRLFHHDGDRDKARAYLYWPATDGGDPAARRRLSLLRAVMDLKMTGRLREELGATYSPSVSSAVSDIYKDYGYFRVMVDLAPARTAEVLAVMEDVVGEVRAGWVSEDELARAKTPILERLDEGDRSNKSLATLLSYAQRQPDWIVDWLERKKHYESIEVADLAAVAEMVLAPAATRRVLILPAPEAPADDVPVSASLDAAAR